MSGTGGAAISIPISLPTRGLVVAVLACINLVSRLRLHLACQSCQIGSKTQSLADGARSGGPGRGHGCGCSCCCTASS